MFVMSLDFLCIADCKNCCRRFSQLDSAQVHIAAVFNSTASAKSKASYVWSLFYFDLFCHAGRQKIRFHEHKSRDGEFYF